MNTESKTPRTDAVNNSQYKSFFDRLEATDKNAKELELKLAEANRKLEAERDNNVCLATENEYQRQLVKDKERKLEVAKDALRLIAYKRGVCNTFCGCTGCLAAQALATITQKENV